MADDVLIPSVLKATSPKLSPSRIFLQILKAYTTQV